ncbi:hemerythrin domain-containing protein [Glaciimonas sp. CA11.2]|uniref:hemerythrin domain-containing protein n=1 Tax=unclassified Glaciimonas TaxID=2644401 RepID=UPI002AB5060B|nr:MULTISPECIES: hemerythrin domain-containing protein [unclassified Glaciimonas]MDY7546684.1 hemerythrin domain-containing protein [Glaciimonas sp. CA11.2]MEB0011809.1 hemerythrin domain-containing protein [Glaciimonas sp. Cout2]MEB0080635.1 hemerythrin domain-containing protein [Glaciimonas sp. Gout2]MEB0162265.1 hemerythrin domain-containing protein [Glaciimonas sp. CA11.2]
MENSLFETAPDFGQPIAVLKHCHERIRKQLATLERLRTHLSEHGANQEAQEAATSILRYFNKAAPHHHDDEEQDLFPMLTATAKDEDAEVLRRLGPEIIDEHQQMAQLWHQLSAQLLAVQSGQSAELSGDDVSLFSTLYLAHMEKEETWIAPMAKRIFSAAQMTLLGTAMQRRRGISV